jgi:preprotein translocase subunit SecE
MNRLFTYIAESRAELTKVNWPNRQTTVQLTILVIVFSLVLAAFIGGLDYLFSIGLQRLIVKG